MQGRRASDDYPRLDADGEGVWIQFNAAESSRSFLAWSDIWRVGGYRVEGMNGETDLFLVLDTGYGEFLELYEGLVGFPVVADALIAHLPGIAPDWLHRLDVLGVDDEELELWHRPRP